MSRVEVIEEERRMAMPYTPEAERLERAAAFRRSVTEAGWYIVRERREHDYFDDKGVKGTFVFVIRPALRQAAGAGGASDG